MMIETKLLRASGTRKWQEIIFLITPSEAAWNGQLWEFHKENRLPAGPGISGSHVTLARAHRFGRSCATDVHQSTKKRMQRSGYTYLFFCITFVANVPFSDTKYYGSMFVANIGNFTNRVPFLNIK